MTYSGESPMLRQRYLRYLAFLAMPFSLIAGMPPAQSQVIDRSTTVQPNRDYYYPNTGSSSGTTIRDSRIRDSTLINPVLIDSEIENSTVINPVIVSPRSNRTVYRGSNRVIYPEAAPTRSAGSRCILFREIRQACQ